MYNLIIVCFLCFLTCNQSSKENIIRGNVIGECENKEVFDDFILLLLAGNEDEIKKTFNFPFNDKNIWHVIFFDNQNQNYDIKKDFLEEDFSKYYSKIFKSELLEHLMNLNTELLFENKECMTKRSKLVFDIETQLFASYDFELDEITLTLNYDFHEDNEVFESSINYVIKFKDCSISLNKLIVSG